MRKLYAVLSLFGLIACIQAVPAKAAPFTDGEFDQGRRHAFGPAWTEIGNPKIWKRVRLRTDPAARLKRGKSAHPGVLYQVFDGLAANTTYTLRFALDNRLKANPKFGLNVYLGAGTGLDVLSPANLEWAWSKLSPPVDGFYTITFTTGAAPGDYTLAFEGFVKKRRGSIRIDDINLAFAATEVPGPVAGAGLPLLAAAGLGVWARRRRTPERPLAGREGVPPVGERRVEPDRGAAATG